MKPNNEVLFSRWNVTPLDIRPQIIQPSKPATLSTPLKTCIQQNIINLPSTFHIYRLPHKYIRIVRLSLSNKSKTPRGHFSFMMSFSHTCFLCNIAPFSFSMDCNIICENFVLLSSPSSLIHFLLRAARKPTHLHFRTPLSLTLSLSQTHTL